MNKEINRNMQGIKKRILISIIIILFLIFNLSYGDDNHGLVRRIHKDGDGKTFYMIEYDLDENGKCTGGVEYFSGIERAVKYIYDQRGNLIQELKGNSKTDSLVEITDYLYNDTGELVEKTNFFLTLKGEKTLLDSETYNYDNSGNLIFQTTSKSGTKTIHEYIYDISGKKISGVIKSEEQVTYANLKYFYNEKGQLQEVIARQPDSQMILWKENYQYDSMGRILREEHLFSQEPEKPGIVKVYEYNNYGKKSRELYLVKGEVKIEIIYQYK